jgi:hypothetical protein
MTSTTKAGSPAVTARIGGFFWLMTAVTGTAALMLGRSLMVRGDDAATIARLIANESTWRMAVGADMLACICYVVATLCVYEVLKPVNRSVSLLAAFFSLLGCAGSIVSFFLYLAPLTVLKGAAASADAQALAMTFIRWRAGAGYVSFAFFGLHVFLVGTLILRSRFLPKAIGLLMTAGGAAWLVMSLTTILAPAFARPMINPLTAIGGLAEITLSLWLLIRGVNTQRWREQVESTAPLSLEQTHA